MPLITIKTGSVDYESLPEEMPHIILKHIDSLLYNRQRYQKKRYCPALTQKIIKQPLSVIKVTFCKVRLYINLTS